MLVDDVHDLIYVNIMYVLMAVNGEIDKNEWLIKFDN